MGIRFGPGPVFEAECLTAPKRVQFYAARVLLVAGLLVGLAVVWGNQGIVSGGLVTVQQLAWIGGRFYTALMGVELSMAIMIAPAAAAGAICQDRAKGGLALMMTTDLSDAEIVLGRLASRLLSTLGVVACGFPVLALATLLGGVDPVAVAGGTLVIVGVAALSVAMALTFSLWAGKPHEALSATYAVWGVWTLALLAWEESIGGAPELLQWSNPFWLLFSNFGMASDRLIYQVGFFLASMTATALLAGLSTWKLRSVTLRKQGKTTTVKSRKPPGPGWLRRIGQGAPPLDDDPILWREWHRKRPSAFSRAIWGTYFCLSALFSFLSLFVRNIAPGTVGFQVSIGLLLACVGAATALAEERAQGGLDVVLVTPIDSRRIILGKWWGAFRIVPRLAILPGLVCLAISLTRGEPIFGITTTLLVVCLILAHGATITGLGLAIAILQPRQGRAVALTVACYLAATVAWPAVFLPMVRGNDNGLLPLWVSPFFGTYVPTCAIAWGYHGPWRFELIGGFGMLALVAVVALGLFQFAIWNFDQGVGRVPERSRRGVTWRTKVDFISSPSARPRSASPSGRSAAVSDPRDRSPLP